MSELRAILWDATWGNNMAALEWATALGVIGWLGRHQIGRRLAAWWDQHHGPLAAERYRQALREHKK